LEELEGGLSLPDKDDCHVLAAAIKAKAEVIVTENGKDFPKAVLDLHNIDSLSLDQFVVDILDLGGAEAVVVLRVMRARFSRPDITVDDLILKIETLGMSETANFLSAYKELL
jgi:hypothetical protein